MYKNVQIVLKGVDLNISTCRQISCNEGFMRSFWTDSLIFKEKKRHSCFLWLGHKLSAVFVVLSCGHKVSEREICFSLSAIDFGQSPRTPSPSDWSTHLRNGIPTGVCVIWTFWGIHSCNMEYKQLRLSKAYITKSPQWKSMSRFSTCTRSLFSN